MTDSKSVSQIASSAKAASLVLAGLSTETKNKALLEMASALEANIEAILEAKLLMLASHNILNPANGAPITVPSQDMVLGLYYITKVKKGTKKEPVKGENKTYYSPEEVIIAYNEKQLDLHAPIKVMHRDMVDGEEVTHLIETTTGRVLFNQMVPKEAGYINGQTLHVNGGTYTP